MFTGRKFEEVPKPITLIHVDPESRCQSRNHRRAHSPGILPVMAYGHCRRSHIVLKRQIKRRTGRVVIAPVRLGTSQPSFCFMRST